jgi:hypothetical protein
MIPAVANKGIFNISKNRQVDKFFTESNPIDI